MKLLTISEVVNLLGHLKLSNLQDIFAQNHIDGFALSELEPSSSSEFFADFDIPINDLINKGQLKIFLKRVEEFKQHGVPMEFLGNSAASELPVPPVVSSSAASSESINASIVQAVRTGNVKDLTTFVKSGIDIKDIKDMVSYCLTCDDVSSPLDRLGLL